MVPSILIIALVAAHYLDATRPARRARQLTNAHRLSILATAQSGRSLRSPHPPPACFGGLAGDRMSFLGRKLGAGFRASLAKLREQFGQHLRPAPVWCRLVRSRRRVSASLQRFRRSIILRPDFDFELGTKQCLRDKVDRFPSTLSTGLRIRTHHLGREAVLQPCKIADTFKRKIEFNTSLLKGSHERAIDPRRWAHAVLRAFADHHCQAMASIDDIVEAQANHSPRMSHRCRRSQAASGRRCGGYAMSPASVDPASPGCWPPRRGLAHTSAAAQLLDLAAGRPA